MLGQHHIRTIYNHLSEFSADKETAQKNTRPGLYRLGRALAECAGRNPRSYGDFVEAKLERIREAKNNAAESAEEVRKVFAKEDIHNIQRGKQSRLGFIVIEWMATDRPKILYDLLKETSFDFSAHREIEWALSEIESHDCFICWTGDFGRAIAESIRSFFAKYDDELSVFLSSVDIGDQPWERALKAGLTSSTRGIVLVTQDAIDSQYLEHEFAVLSANTLGTRVYLLDTPPAILSAPMRNYQYHEFSFENLRDWLTQAFKIKGTKFEKEDLQELEENVAEIRERFSSSFVTADNLRWEENYARPILMSAQQSSPYDLEQIIDLARDQLVLVAQNHYHMTTARINNSERYWPLLVNALQRGVDVDIVSMHPDAVPPTSGQVSIPSAIDVWSLYMTAPEFSAHLQECWQTYESWHLRYATLANPKERLGDLRFHAAYFTPLTASFVDPEDNARGLLVLSPRTGHEAAGPRPHFILRRRHEHKAFTYYWETFKNGFGNAGWERRLPAPTTT